MSVLSMPISALRGIGAKRLSQFARLGITDLDSLLRHYPRQYEDWSSPCLLRDAPRGESCCIRATLMTSPKEHPIRKGLTLYKFTATDGLDGVQITLFNNPYLAQKLRRDETYYFFGTVTGPPDRGGGTAGAGTSDRGGRARPAPRRPAGGLRAVRPAHGADTDPFSR